MRHLMVPALLVVVMLAIACGGNTIPLSNTPLVPAAQGEIHRAVGDNGNLRLTIEVKHLATPEKVSPGAKAYVVWCASPSGTPRNVGALKVDAELSGRLETVAPPGSLAVFITAEEDPAAIAPTGPRVLSSAPIR